MTYYRRKQYLRKNRTALLQAKAGNLPDIQKPLQKKPAALEVKGESMFPKVPLTQSSNLAMVEVEEPTEEVCNVIDMVMCKYLHAFSTLVYYLCSYCKSSNVIFVTV